MTQKDDQSPRLLLRRTHTTHSEEVDEYLVDKVYAEQPPSKKEQKKRVWETERDHLMIWLMVASVVSLFLTFGSPNPFVPPCPGLTKGFVLKTRKINVCPSA